MIRKQTHRVHASVAVAVTLSLMLASHGSEAASESAAGASGEIEIFSWWTSGSEHAALEVLFDTLTTANPDIEVVDAAVAGGAGTNARQVLATRISSGDVPETWQTHAGGALADYVRQGVTVDLTALYEENSWADVLPAELLESLMVDGEIHAVSTGVHRGNNLFYNTAVLEAAGVELRDTTDWATLEAAAQQIQESGVDPLCLGDKDVWTDVTLLENLIVSEVGAEGWMQLLNGERSWSDPNVLTAVDHFLTALTWAQPDHQALDWTGAVTALAEGRCAFNSMGDWEYGELLVKHELVDGVDFDATILGDPNVFVTVTDVFVVGADSSNQEAAMQWAVTLMDPDAQLGFNELKGSSPARIDVDVSGSGPIAQRNAETLGSGILVPSLVQDQALIPPTVSQAFAESAALLVASGDAEAFGAAMDAAIEAT